MSTKKVQIVGANILPQTDWNQTDTTQHDYLKNKPTNVSDFTNDAGYQTASDVATATAGISNLQATVNLLSNRTTTVENNKLDKNFVWGTPANNNKAITEDYATDNLVRKPLSLTPENYVPKSDGQGGYSWSAESGGNKTSILSSWDTMPSNPKVGDRATNINDEAQGSIAISAVTGLQSALDGKESKGKATISNTQYNLARHALTVTNNGVTTTYNFLTAEVSE